MKAHQRATFGPGSGRIWLDDMRCTGREMNLESCKRNRWGSNNCGHYEDAGVTCLSEKSKYKTRKKAFRNSY